QLVQNTTLQTQTTQATARLTRWLKSPGRVRKHFALFFGDRKMTLDVETKQQLKALFDQALNDKIATMKTEILNEILGKVESKMHTITAVSESFNKLGQHAAACKPNEVKNEISSLKADVLELHKNVSQIRDALAT